jgi:phosphoribosylamine--glycine ligase/phosphoribosylglycinamide formyltransferase/phosphoribosylformylglycinamidine cyclo-ligase
LKPTRIYVRDVLPLIESQRIKAFAHITGGGLYENVVRVIPKNLKVDLDASRWDIPPVFSWIATQGWIPN